MIVAATVLMLASAVSAAPTTPVAAKGGGAYWFKTYSTAPYKEYWTAELTVQDFPKTMPKVVDAVAKNGGKLTQPLRNFASSKKDEIQQLSFSLPLAGAKSLLKSLRALGTLPDPAVRTVGAPIPIDEVKAKIAVLMKEKTEHADALAQVPATAAAVEEILEHLLLVEEVSSRTDTEVLVNLQVRRE